jgi:hypothetical protein
MFSAHRPEDVLAERERAGCTAVVFLLIVVAFIGAWTLLHWNEVGPSPSPSPSPSPTMTNLGGPAAQVAPSVWTFHIVIIGGRDYISD